MKHTPINKFAEIISNKANTISIAEKAITNLEIKLSCIKDYKYKESDIKPIHYFAIGHTFKNIDCDYIFERKVDETSLKKIPTKYLTLQYDSEDIKNTPLDIVKIHSLINKIRNLNSHFIHDFEGIQITTSNNLQDFLRESFELAALNVSGIINKKYSEEIQNKELASFLKNKFNILSTNIKTKTQCINDILFINNTNTEFTTPISQWNLNNKAKAFDISEGIYYSFNACLFILTMFLYKDEANLLISKIRGFKRNATAEEQTKRDIFTFYSKKLKSQDIDSEQSSLVKFRDLIQYLNKYPTEWNKAYTNPDTSNTFKENFREKIMKLETRRAFLYNNNNRFYTINNEEEEEDFFSFTKYHLWGLESKRAHIRHDFSNNQIANFNNMINTSLHIQGLYKKQNDLNNKLNTEKKKIESYIRERNINNINKDIKDNNFLIEEAKDKDKINSEELIEERGKLIGTKNSYEAEIIKTRAFNGDLLTSYGRNNDRFMEFATRFLAEKDYFGDDAKFKCYKHHTTEEQNKDLITLKESLTKKEFDSLKFHQGKLVEFITYKEFLKKKRFLDVPFVLQNNGILIKIKLGGKERTVSIQRKLMVYFLQHALENIKSKNPGFNLLNTYYSKYKNEFKQKLDTLNQKDNISTSDKNEFKRLFPRKLLNNYCPAQVTDESRTRAVDVLLSKTKEQDSRYKLLLKEAQAKGIEADFLKKNKGKQYKLNFVRRAWNLMYFRDIYFKQKELAGSHHKGFNITKDEYNDFCKAMFLFENHDDVYKRSLISLFKSKKFFDNSEFESLFNKSNNLDELYLKTIMRYESWLTSNDPEKKKKNAHKIEDYNFINDSNKETVFFINISHFIAFLIDNKKFPTNKNNKIDYIYLNQNCEYLVSEYYLSEDTFNKDRKTFRKLFNQLNSIRLEDSLLYEIAIHYLSLDNNIRNTTKDSIQNIFNQDIAFNIPNNSSSQYKLIVPFSKILDFELWLKRKEKEEKDKKKLNISYLERIPKYLEVIRLDDNKDKISEIISDFNSSREISYNSFSYINSHLLKNANTFSSIWMKLEEYFLNIEHHHNTSITLEDHRVNWADVTGITKYNFTWKEGKKEENMRDSACHLDIPAEKSYYNALCNMEKTFLKDEVKHLTTRSFNDLPKNIQTVCNAFNKFIHPEFFNYSEKDNDKRIANANKNYFNHIKKII